MKFIISIISASIFAMPGVMADSQQAPSVSSDAIAHCGGCKKKDKDCDKKKDCEKKDEATLIADNCKKDCGKKKDCEKKDEATLIADNCKKDCGKKKDCEKKDEATLIAGKECGKGCGGKKDKDAETLLIAA